ncbi:MAG: 5-(carboxyamino)imidazole ribonucleotide synthase [Myxococcales bacterium]|nr:5-(carboxyamino)imidazole ribonucleotide synthase [Myxococcales bacterium]MCB9702654.1 5-(carboxyamino)imidazole ribonucleotide synthase [Myxococcales bacterium]
MSASLPPPILPGATIGVLGSGQLGRMFTIAARALGYRVHTFSPDDDTPTGQVADREVCRSYDDLDAVRQFAGEVDVITFEFENVPSATAAAAAERAPVRPAGALLELTQHRLREKGGLRARGFPTARFLPIRSLADLEGGLRELGAPALLKTAGWGYDGKGQALIAGVDEAAAGWRSLATDEAILEELVDFERELSVIVARGQDGGLVTYGPVENHHVRGILDLTLAPAPVEAGLAARARELAAEVARSLELCGVLCAELFVTARGDLLINELAPRPHNSGHYTIDACVTSQFEQQVRAVCGLPLGSPEQVRPAAMVNLLGDLWAEGTPRWAAALADPRVKLHLYGKREARPGRKMGHLCALAASLDEARDAALAARRALAGS